MIKNIQKGWVTSIFGAIILIGSAYGYFNPEQAEAIGTLGGAIAGVILLFAKDPKQK